MWDSSHLVQVSGKFQVFFSWVTSQVMSSHVVKASQVQKTEHHLLLVSTKQMMTTDITRYQARESVLHSCERTSRLALAKGS